MKASVFSSAVEKHLTSDDYSRLSKTRWFDRLTSLWAPISIFGLVFVVYLIIVEFWICGYPILQPVLQGFGLLMLAYYLGLVGMRAFARPLIRQRTERHEAEDLVSNVHQTVDQFAGKLGAKIVEELAERSAGVIQAVGHKDAALLNEKTKGLREASTKHLKKFERGSAGAFAGGFVNALLVALLIRSVVVEPFKIPSGSMIPTLEIGDQIFVNKFIYGVRVPFLNKVPFVLVREPKKGDVVVFDNQLVGKDFIKRIVATPGDRIQVHDSLVSINGTPLPTEVENSDYISWEMPHCDQGFFACIPTWFQDDWRPVHARLSREVSENRPHYILNREFSNPSDIDMIVPPRSVFVMGDNRDNSEDSRFGLGGGRQMGVQFVPYDDIKGKATVIWLSLSRGGLLSSMFGGTGIRGDRFFRSVSLCGNEPTR